MQCPMRDCQSMSAEPQGVQVLGKSDNWNAPGVGECGGVCLIPAIADVGIYLRATVELSDGRFAYTRMSGCGVKNTSDATLEGRT